MLQIKPTKTTANRASANVPIARIGMAVADWKVSAGSKPAHIVAMTQESCVMRFCDGSTEVAEWKDVWLQGAQPDPGQIGSGAAAVYGIAIKV